MGQGEQIVLARWHYAPDEWNQFVDGEWKRFWSRFRRSSIFLAIGLAAFITLVGVTSFMSSGLAAAFVGVLWLGVPGTIALGGLAFINYRAQQNRCARLRALPPEIVITPRFVVFGGDDYLKTNMYKRLTSQQSVWARVEGTSPAILRIDVVEWTARGVPDELRLPIPPGHENEARAVVEHLSWRSRSPRSRLARNRES
jgi:hypothetical protein